MAVPGFLQVTLARLLAGGNQGSRIPDLWLVGIGVCKPHPFLPMVGLVLSENHVDFFELSVVTGSDPGSGCCVQRRVLPRVENYSSSVSESTGAGLRFYLIRGSSSTSLISQFMLGLPLGWMLLVESSTPAGIRVVLWCIAQVLLPYSPWRR